MFFVNQHTPASIHISIVLTSHGHAKQRRSNHSFSVRLRFVPTQRFLTNKSRKFPSLWPGMVLKQMFACQ